MYRDLEFDVSGQQLTKKIDCNFDNIVAGTRGYLRAVFHFETEDWKDCIKAAGFYVRDMEYMKRKEYAVLLDENDTCVIPEEVLGYPTIEVSLTGVKEGYRITSSLCDFEQEVL